MYKSRELCVCVREKERARERLFVCACVCRGVKETELFACMFFCDCVYLDVFVYLFVCLYV